MSSAQWKWEEKCRGPDRPSLHHKTFPSAAKINLISHSVDFQNKIKKIPFGKDGTRRGTKTTEEDQDDLKHLYFNAKDKEQLENIKKALKGEHDLISNNTYKNSNNTKADTSHENLENT